MKFNEMLQKSWDKNGSLLCVGLDPAPEKFPEKFSNFDRPIFYFCKEIIDATADLVCAYKPQIAYFSSCSAEEDLIDLIDYIHTRYPGIPVILDAKRGDIGSTAMHYARESFERFQADCVTLSPYMGKDSIDPYLQYPDKGEFILCRTSNKGGDDFQMLDVGGEPLYMKVARKVDEWNVNKQMGLVIGATYPAEIKAVREIAPDLTFLVPGVGAQGGDIEAVVKTGINGYRTGLVINSSRAILYASSGSDFAEAARKEAKRTRDAINFARF